jgi:hypothetical protein
VTQRLSASAESVRIAMYLEFAEHGGPPARSALATSLGFSDDEYDEALDELVRSRNVVLRDDQIEMAHPFATRSFGFSVMGPRTLWWGGCAWDSFAIPHLVPGSPEVLVATTCPACRTAHAWSVGNEAPPAGDQVAHFLTPMHEIWPDAAHACEHQQIFCSSACVDDWLARTGNRRGYEMDLGTLWRLASRWYEGRLDSPYQRREPAAASAYFASVGLRGAFWGLEDEGPSTAADSRPTG